METWVRPVDNVAVDVFVVENHDQLATMMHPVVLAMFVQAPNGTVKDDIYDPIAGTWSHPPAPELPPEPEPDPAAP